MNIQIGETIRKLRIKANITQEKLANHLGVSTQAVSRWESGKCYPDLEIIPSLAIFFGVSADVILCIDKKITSDTINNIISDWRNSYKAGDFEKANSIITEGLQKFPLNYDLMVCKAMIELIYVEISQNENDTENADKHLNNGRDMLYKILDECKEENTRADARNLLIGLEGYLNNFNQFHQLTDNLASVTDSKNSILYKFHYDEEERDNYARKYIYELIFELIYCLLQHSRSALIEDDTRITIYNEIFRLLEDFVGGPIYGEFEYLLDSVYENLYNLTHDESYKKEIGRHIEIYNNLPETFEYESIFLKGCTFRIKDSLHSIDGSLK